MTTNYPDLRPSTLGHWPPRIELLPRGVPVLGEHLGLPRGTLVGWSSRPEATWQPSDLLWTPPGVKSLDVAGTVVDVRTYANVPSHTWVAAQLQRRDRYRDFIKRKVLGGAYRLSPALAKLLGIDEDGALLDERHLDAESKCGASSTPCSVGGGALDSRNEGRVEPSHSIPTA